MFMVVLAQLVEHRIVVPSVVGSSPTFHPNTAEIPFGIAAVFFCADVRARTHLIGVPDETCFGGESEYLRLLYTLRSSSVVASRRRARVV